jgi:hypothetical protein
MNANNARDGDGDLIIDLLDCDAADSLIAISSMRPKTSSSFAVTTLHKVPGDSISEILPRRRSETSFGSALNTAMLPDEGDQGRLTTTRLLPKFRVATEAINCDLKASAKMLSALVACSITFGYQFFERWAQVWMTMKNDRALCNYSTMRYRQPTKGRFKVSTRIRPTISKARFFDGRNSGRSGDEGAESRPYPFN